MPDWLSNFLIKVYVAGFTWLCIQLQPPIQVDEDSDDDARWYEVEKHEEEIKRREHD